MMQEEERQELLMAFVQRKKQYLRSKNKIDRIKANQVKKTSRSLKLEQMIVVNVYIKKESTMERSSLDY